MKKIILIIFTLSLLLTGANAICNKEISKLHEKMAKAYSDCSESKNMDQLMQKFWKKSLEMNNKALDLDYKNYKTHNTSITRKYTSEDFFFYH